MEKAKKLEFYRRQIHKSPLQFSDVCVTSQHLDEQFDDVPVKASVSSVNTSVRPISENVLSMHE